MKILQINVDGVITAHDAMKAREWTEIFSYKSSNERGPKSMNGLWIRCGLGTKIEKRI